MRHFHARSQLVVAQLVGSLAALTALATLAACPAPPGTGEGEGASAEGEGAAGEGEGAAGEGEGEGVVVEPGDPGPADVVLAVRVDTARRAISPLVYGYNGDADGATLARSGGNRLTAYNWENNASNAGSDYCNQNDSSMGSASDPPASAFAALLDTAQSSSTAVLLTVSLQDVVAADTNDLGDGGQGPPACVGDVANSGSDYLTTRFVPNHARKGAAFADPPDTGDGAVYQDELVAYVKTHWPAVPKLFDLDNEPDLWASTHARIHPNPVSYSELVDRTTSFAAAVKDADASATVLAGVSYGYYGYLTLQDAPDAGADGDFIDFFLAALADDEASNGRRVVDALDLHWYPEAVGDSVRVSDVDDATGAAARVQAPRSLFDDTYVEDSWIHDSLGGSINLLPELFAQIDAHYPGTKLSFSEWNYGGGSDISGAIATADVLGIFGREGVFASTLFPLHGAEPFNHAGLRIFRCATECGALFGATSIAATSSDLERVSVYASDDPLAVVVINRSSGDLVAGLTIAAHATSSLHRFVLDGSAATIGAAADVDAVDTNAFSVPLPAMSVTLLTP